MSVRLTAAGVMTLAAVGCVSDPEPAQLHQALVGGEVTAGDPAVVALVDGRGGMACSGVLVAPDVVVTAAHCLVDTPRPAVFFGARVGGAGTVVEAIDHAIDPAYRTGEVGPDLGVLFLAEESPVAPLPLGTPPAAGTTLRLVGFGADGATNLESDGEKRTGPARVESVGADHVRIVPDPAQPCGGDSGAPALAIVDGVEHVVGIVSRGDPDCLSFALLARGDRARRLTEDVASGSISGGCAGSDQAAPISGGCIAGGDGTVAPLAVVFVLVLVRKRRAR